MYNLVKILHVLSASLLFSMTLISAIYLLILHLKQDLKHLQALSHKFIPGLLITISLIGLWQLASGFSLLFMQSHRFTQLWILQVMSTLTLLALLWFISLYLQLRSVALLRSINKFPDIPARYFRYYRVRWLLGCLMYPLLFLLYFFMTNLPHPYQ